MTAEIVVNNWFTEPGGRIPVIRETDVLVVGGGPAGVGAAVAAAKNGAKVILLERYGYLGGLSTGGLVIVLINMTDQNKLIVGGLCREFVHKLQTMNAVRPWSTTATSLDKTRTSPISYVFDSEHLKYLMNEVTIESGVEVFLHSLAVGAIVKDHRVRVVITESKAGRGAIAAKVFVDTTGDADMTKWCNLPFEKKEPAPSMSVGLPFRIGNVDIEKARRFCAEAHAAPGGPTGYYKTVASKVTEASKIENETAGTGIWWIQGVNRGEVWCNIINFPGVDPLSPENLSSAEIEGRKRIIKLVEAYRYYVPGFENAFLLEIAPQIGIRESRRIRGRYRLTRKDLEQGRTFNDRVGLSWNGVLAKKMAKEQEEKGAGNKNGYSFGIPFGCLLPDGVSNLLFAGRCISVDADILEYVRMIPQCILTGEAAGTAAALAVQQQVPPDRLDITRIQTALRKQGAVL